MSLPGVRGILSGGQTGVDQAAHRSALRHSLPVDGWCPADRRAEDGPIPPDIRLRPTPSTDPSERTAWNVFDSDATLVLTDQPLSGGTGWTVDVCRKSGRPHLVLDPGSSDARSDVLEWIRSLPTPLSLNVAGPRESGSPGIGRRTEGLLDRVFARLTQSPPRKALITGAAGFLGSRILELTPPGWLAVGAVRPGGMNRPGTVAVDLAEPRQVDRVLEQVKPDLVIHTAYSKADPERDILIATRNLAASQVPLIHISSDMVLSGCHAPYDERAPRNPVLDYGRWKARAEVAVEQAAPGAAIVRISLITDFRPGNPRDFVTIKALRSGDNVRLFADEVRTPILRDDLARQLWEIARLDASERAGVWNLAGPEALSRLALGALTAWAYRLPADSLEAGRSRDHPEPRPIDLRLLTIRADRALLTHASPVSIAALKCRSLLSTQLEN